MLVYVTGDAHGRFERFRAFCDAKRLTPKDLIVVLGDAGLNYHLDERDDRLKTFAASVPAHMLFIYGNHEERPENISGYRETEGFGGTVYVQERFPSLLFAKDGEVYDLDGVRCIAIGGAYSIDKPFRLAKGLPWFPDEQPSDRVKRRVERSLASLDWKVDFVLSHTVPRRYVPTEAFIPGIDQCTVDRSTEEWLGELEGRLSYKRWYAGHYHVTKEVDRMKLMFEDWSPLSGFGGATGRGRDRRKGARGR